MKPTTQKLIQLPAEILKTTTRFPYSFFRTSDALSASLHQFGLMHPLLTWKSSDGMEVVDGVKRLVILRDQKYTTIPVFVMENASRETAFIMGLEANRWVKSFNLIEKGNILREAFQLFSEAEICVEILPRLEIQNIYQARELMRFTRLPIEIQNFIVEKNIPQHEALLWFHFPVNEVLGVYEFINKLPVNQNKLATILKGVAEIAARDSLQITEILARIMAHIHKGKMGHEEVEKIIGMLEGIRYPRYAQKKDDFRNKAKKLSLPSGTKIAPNPYFEEKGFELKAKISSQSDRKELIESLENPEWDELFSI